MTTNLPAVRSTLSDPTYRGVEPSQLLEDPSRLVPQLVEWIVTKRWFLAKEQRIAYFELADAVVFAGNKNAGVHGLFVRFTFNDGRVSPEQKTYFIPVVLSLSPLADVPAEDCLKLSLSNATLYLSLAEHTSIYQQCLFQYLQEEQSIPTRHHAAVKFESFQPALQLEGLQSLRTSPLNVSSSNVLTSVESAAGKWISKTYKDVRGNCGEAELRWQPNYEIMRYAALKSAGYKNLPELLGTVTYNAEDGSPACLGIIMQCIQQEDEIGSIFWRALDRYLKKWSLLTAPDEAFHSKYLRGATMAARTIAKSIAVMHAAFMQAEGENFKCVPTANVDIERWLAAPVRDISHAQEDLRSRQDTDRDDALDGLIRQLGQITGADAKTEGILRTVVASAGELFKSQVHGDLHTAQGLILSAPEGSAIDTFLESVESDDSVQIEKAAARLKESLFWIDFEGTPAKEPVDLFEDGRSCPFADLAGIAQAFSYIANLRLYEELGINPRERKEDRSKARWASLALSGCVSAQEVCVAGLTPELIGLLNRWVTELTGAFVDGYLEEIEQLGASGNVMGTWDKATARRLVSFWIVARAAHELRYETYGRDWAWEAIPGGRALEVLRNLQAELAETKCS